MNSNEASKITGIKDMTIGAVKETLGSMTGNQRMELQGKAQKVHGKNEYDFAKAQTSGETEPERFKSAYHSHDSEATPTEGQVEGDKASTLSGFKDQFVGGVKETMGSASGNQNMELLGKAQAVHGRNETEFAKAERQGLNEPEHFVQGTKTTETASGTVEGEKASSFSGMADRAIGSVKESMGSVTGNQKMELLGKAQSVHGRNETEFAKAEKHGLIEPEHFVQGTKTTEFAEGAVEGQKASSFSGMADRAVGSIKETMGSVTGNQNMELLGKAQSIHGRNESEFAKAERQGLNEPEHFVQGTKSTDQAEGSVVGDSASSLHAIKDRVVGTVKETFGSVTGNQQTELLGKAQAVHGRNEAEFAKAERQGLNEPEHFVQGTKTTEIAEGSVEGDKASRMSGITDRAIGSIKETIGSATGNQNMELLGKAQAVHGRNESEFAKAEKQGLNEPEHFVQGTKTTEFAEGAVEGQKASSFSGMADRAVGSIKETMGSVTGNQNMELLGKAQAVHGRNESEFAKAERQGLNEPEHFVQGTKTTEFAEGAVEGENASRMSGLADRAIGSIKEGFGSVTGNQQTELLGKAQAVHGRNESEFAKAQKEGMSEPENFVKPVEPAQGSVEESKPSSMSGMSDRAMGSVKETIGNVTGNQKMEIEGMAQKIHGRNEADLARAQKEISNA